MPRQLRVVTFTTSLASRAGCKPDVCVGKMLAWYARGPSPRADAMPPPPEPLAKAKATGPLFPPMASSTFFARGRRAPRERFAFPLATGSPSQLP